MGTSRRHQSFVKAKKEDKDRLFEKYIRPNLDFIYSLTSHYTDRRQDIDANYNYVITQMYRYIASYDSSKPLNTWLHIVTKRYCYNQNKERAKVNSIYDGMQFRADGELPTGSGVYEINPFTLLDSVSDDMYYALTKIPFENLSALLLQVQGYSVKEITEIEYTRGHIPRQCEDLIKRRLAICRKELKEILKSRGISRQSYPSYKTNHSTR